MKRLCLILGDQLALDAPLLASLKPGADALLMIEAGSEAQFVWSHQARIALFLSAMRHFAQAVRETTKLDVHYVTLETSVAPDFADQLKQQLRHVQPIDPAYEFTPAQYLADEALGTRQRYSSGTISLLGCSDHLTGVQQMQIQRNGQQRMPGIRRVSPHRILRWAEIGQATCNEMLQGLQCLGSRDRPGE